MRAADHGSAERGYVASTVTVRGDRPPGAQE
jgi:hypothetical protein